MKHSLVCGGALLLLTCPGSTAQLPDACKTAALPGNGSAAESSASVYDAVGARFAEKGDLKCAAAAFEQALRCLLYTSDAADE